MDALGEEHGALRAELDALVSRQVDGMGEDMAVLHERLGDSETALVELRAAIDEISGKSEVEADDFEGLVAVAAELDARLNEVDAELMERLGAIDKRVGAVDFASRERFEAVGALSSELAQNRSELEDLISGRLQAMSAERAQDRSELEALDERIDALTSDRAHIEGVVAEQVAALVAERDQLRVELDELIRERVDALIVDRNEVRQDLERLVAEQAGELGADVTSLGDRLEVSDGVIAELRSAIEEVSGRDVVDRAEYDSVTTLAEELELAVTEARLLADRAIDQLSEATTASDARHSELVEQFEANETSASASHDALVARLETVDSRHDELLDRIEYAEASLNEQHNEVADHLEAVESDLREQSKALLSATEETLELSIKAADKAESAADNADGIRADHEDHIAAYLEEHEAQTERLNVLEEHDVSEGQRRRTVDKKFRTEIDQLVERLNHVERSVAEHSDPADIIDLPEPEAPGSWQFERRGRWGHSEAEQS